MAQSSTLQLAAVKRLLIDLKEVVQSPLLNVTARPLDADLFTWHGSVRSDSEDGCLGGAPIHFALRLPLDYPRSAPECFLFNFVAHANVTAVPAHQIVEDGPKWRLALFDCIPEHNTWVGAYSVLSVLVQLQAFLLTEDLQFDNAVIAEEAASQANDFSCATCGHTGAEPLPVFPNVEECYKVVRARPPTCTGLSHVPAKNREALRSMRDLARLNPTLPAQGPAKTTTTTTTTTQKPGSAWPDSRHYDHPAAKQPRWERPGTSKGGQYHQSYNNGGYQPKPGYNGGGYNGGGYQPKSGHNNSGYQSQHGYNGGGYQPKPGYNNGGYNSGGYNGGGYNYSGGYQSKPRYNNGGYQSKPGYSNGGYNNGGSYQSKPGYNTGNQPKPAQPAHPPPASPAPPSGPTWLTSLQAFRNKPHAQLIQAVYDSCAAELQQAEEEAKAAPAISAAHDRAPVTEGLNLGPLWGMLARDELITVLSRLPGSAVGALAAASKGLNRVCQDGEVWRSLLARDFPGTGPLAASQAKGWRHAYQLEAAGVPGDLCCWYSRASAAEAVLGLPLRYTVNPRTREIDYIEADMELLAVDAFKAGVSRRADGQEKIDVVLPLYINASHFDRAQGALYEALQVLAPATGNQARDMGPSPERWLEVIPKILNTCVVLLSDRGVDASRRALSTYCSLHRLLLALCERYDLWGRVASTIDDFMQSGRNRVKSACPNLGVLVPLLGASPKHAWSQVAAPIIVEAMDRNVLWICKADPTLVANFSVPPSTGGVDNTLLEQSCWGSGVSLRIFMFHAAFVSMVSAPPRCSMEQVMDLYDTMYGRPGAGLVARFQERVCTILDAGSWHQFLSLTGLPPRTDAQMTEWLRSCWLSSLEKRYHERHTDFYRIQSKGVSRILLKGQRYTAPPGMKTVDIEERWGWRGGDTKYLDASCLLYGNQGELLEAVDYNHTESHATSHMGAVRHSGDVLEGRTGKHTISIALDRLGPGVAEMWLTMSSWAGAKLADITQPFILVQEPRSKMELCRFNLEAKEMAQKQVYSCVIMCRIFRKAGARDQWEVQAVGQLCHGAADDYAAVEQAISAIPRR